MKKVIILLLLLITIFAVFGCTRVPNSLETGALPGEYNGKDTDELVKENEGLSADLDKITEELELLKQENSNLMEDNDEIKKELEDAKSLLNILQNEELPKFSSGETDKKSILDYLNEIKSVLTDTARDVEIIDFDSNDDIVLFVMIGYEKHNQLFVWRPGDTEPDLINGLYYNKDGNYKWLLEDKYLIIDMGNSEDHNIIVFDVEELVVINSFEGVFNDLYLIPDTAFLIMKKNNSNSKYLIFNFITSEEKDIILDFQNESLEFKVKDGKFIFSSDYKDSFNVEYSVEAAITIDKLKEKYELKSLEESLKEKQEEIENLEGLEDTV